MGKRPEFRRQGRKLLQKVRWAVMVPWPQEGGTEVIVGMHNGKAAGLGAVLDVVCGGERWDKDNCQVWGLTSWRDGAAIF